MTNAKQTDSMKTSNTLQETVQAMAEEEAAAIESQAMELADRFWAEHWSSVNKGDRGYLGIRVRRRGAHVGIEWFRVRFRRTQGEGLHRYFEYLRRGKTLRYPASAFGSWCRDWERALALELEQEFGPLRRRVEALSRLTRAARDYDRAEKDSQSGVADTDARDTPESMTT